MNLRSIYQGLSNIFGLAESEEEREQSRIRNEQAARFYKENFPFLNKLDTALQNKIKRTKDTESIGSTLYNEHNDIFQELDKRHIKTAIVRDYMFHSIFMVAYDDQDRVFYPAGYNSLSRESLEMPNPQSAVLYSFG